MVTDVWAVGRERLAKADIGSLRKLGTVRENNKQRVKDFNRQQKAQKQNDAEGDINKIQELLADEVDLPPWRKFMMERYPQYYD